MASDERFHELWEQHGEHLLCALINGDRGWLMWLAEAGDSGYRSQNASYDGSPTTMIEYELSNGQRDEYPAAWAYPVDVVSRALEYFRQTGERAPFVGWHCD